MTRELIGRIPIRIGLQASAQPESGSKADEGVVYGDVPRRRRDGSLCRTRDFARVPGHASTVDVIKTGLEHFSVKGFCLSEFLDHFSYFFRLFFHNLGLLVVFGFPWYFVGFS